MKIAADTNVLVRAMTGDDLRQSRIAQSELAKADVVALAIPALCELIWYCVKATTFRRLKSRTPFGASSTARTSW